jgi:bifunctional non-homologous end joining protein LigD
VPTRSRRSTHRHQTAAALPAFVQPQLSKLVKEPPTGTEWLHEIKFDGYRMHARLDHGDVRLLTRTGLDWTKKYPRIAEALRSLPVSQAYLDGELCGVRPDGTTSFNMIQAASDSGNSEALVFFLFDLLHLDGEDLVERPLAARKERLADTLRGIEPPLLYTDHQVGLGPAFYAEVCNRRLEGVVSKRADAPYVPGDRGLWLKTKCLNREEFIVVGWTDPEGSRPYVGAVLLGHYDERGRLIYAGRGGTGISDAELERLWRRLQPLGTKTMPLDAPPPRTTHFGSPLELSRVHWVRPELVVEVAFLAWTDEGLLRQVTYQGIRDDKPAREVRRQAHPGAQRRLHAAPPQSASSTTWKISRENIQRLLADAEVPSRDQLTAYWQRVGKRALEYIGRRPLTLVRRIGGKAFFNEGPLPPIPATVHQLRFEKGEGGEGTRVWVDDVAGLLGLVDMDVIEVHPWGAKVDNIERPDMLVFDLDPGEGVEWQFVIETALRLRDVLATVELDSWPKTTGGKGLHVVVPRIPEMTWATARDYSRTVAEHFAATDPSRYTSKSGRSGRAGKVFIDYLRNGRGNTSIGAYSPRARAGFPVAAPVTWRDVERGIRSDAFSIHNPPVSLRAPRRKR